MLATFSQFSFLLVVALCNFGLGFALARHMGFGLSAPIVSPPLREPTDDCQSIKVAAPETRSEPLDSPPEPAPIKIDSLDDIVAEVSALIARSRAAFTAITEPLTNERAEQTPVTVEAAAGATNDEAQQFQQRLNSLADRLRKCDAATGAELAAAIDELWNSISESLVQLLVLSFDEDVLEEAIGQLVETIQTITSASEGVAAHAANCVRQQHETTTTTETT